MKKWFKQNDAFDATASLIKTLICHLHLPVSVASIEKMVVSHKEYPYHSIVSLQQMLSEWGIRTLEIKTRLTEIPPFSILVLNSSDNISNNSPYAMFYKFDDDAVEYLLPEQGWITEELDIFEQKWSKTALAITAIKL